MSKSVVVNVNKIPKEWFNILRNMLIRFLAEKINTAIISVFPEMSYFFSFLFSRKMGFGL